MESSATSELQQLLSIPPTDFRGDSKNQHAVAHAALEALRNSGDERCLFLRSVLELMTDPYKNEELLFHCITGVRHVILHKWTGFSIPFRDSVRDFFMTIGLSNMPRAIEISCYSVSASCWKRQWNESFNDRITNQDPLRLEEVFLNNAMTPHQQRIADKKGLFLFLENELLRPGGKTIATGCTYLRVFLGEFSGKSAVQYHLPLEFHMKAHSSFEEDGWLNEALRLSMGSLSEIVSRLLQNSNDVDEAFALAAVELAIDLIGWEFGKDAWDVRITHSSSRTLLRLPVAWNEYLIRPDFVGAVFHIHESVARHGHNKLAHAIRQLLLLLASLSGPIFSDEPQRIAFSAFLVDGTLTMLSLCESTEKSSELLDVLSMLSRIVANFKIATLAQSPEFFLLLNAMATIGISLLQGNVQECESVKGNIDDMQQRDWREEALAILLEGAVLLCGDHWLVYSTSDESRKAQTSLSNALTPLYEVFVSCRIRMAKLEEYHLTANAEDLDDVREDISATNFLEEMSSVAIIGRLNPAQSIMYLSSLFHPVQPQLRALWGPTGQFDVSPHGAALLEEARVLILCTGHLLTDENAGETSVIPESIVLACTADSNTTSGITMAVQSILSLAELQTSAIVKRPSDPRLSPLLASTVLWFLNRWAPAYIHPITYGSAGGDSPSLILLVWAKGQPLSEQTVAFCTTLCLNYQCYWPHEHHVQKSTQSLMVSLANRGEDIRSLLVASPSFRQIVTMHCLTAGIRHNAPPSELLSAIQAKANEIPFDMAHGYQRLSYDDRSRTFTALLLCTCDLNNSESTSMMNESLGAVQIAFSSLVQALSSKQILSSDINAMEMTSLCVEMYGGVARASEMVESERVPLFITPSLVHLSGLMAFYAEDLSICEGLLRFFRDYTEQFVAMLTTEQSVALFTASAELLKLYSARHCSARVVKRPVSSLAELVTDEEQSYTDILCVIQFLIHLGTKDFIDICTTLTDSGVNSSQVTDIIFFGLQQILPLMTQGLLLYPDLCTQYFSLVSFMMDTYPDKVCILPYELFDALLESLLFGMSHVDGYVSKTSLQGIAAVVREHIKSHALANHLASHPDIFDKCTRRLLQEVVFQSIVWDRLEPAGLLLLPLAAANINRFVIVVNGLTQQAPSEHQPRLQAAFQILIQPEVLTKVSSGGYEGRMNRMRFKKDFDVFVKEVHSFLVLK